MPLTKIEIRSSRMANAIACLVFGGMAYMFFDAVFLGNISIDIRPIWLWVFFCLSGVAAFGTLKNTLSPGLIFVADSWGLKVRHGLFFNKVRQLRWSELVGIEEGVVKVPRRRTHGRRLFHELPAVRLVFHESIDLGRLGYGMFRPEKKRNYLIAAQLFQRPLPETMAILLEMKKTYA